MSEIRRSNLTDLVGLEPMPGSRCYGQTAFSLGGVIGADLIDLPEWTGFPVHTHPGHHVLLVLEGLGSLASATGIHLTRPGDLLLIPGDEPHAVGGGAHGQRILAIGAPHRVTADPLRMTAVSPPWELACHIDALQPPPGQPLHTVDCLHCPCPECTSELASAGAEAQTAP